MREPSSGARAASRCRRASASSWRCRAAGGYGDPFERDPERVRDDVRNELVSPEAAARDYGVVLGADGSVDRTATEARRAVR